MAKKRRKREEEDADKKNLQLKIQTTKGKKDKKKKALSTLEKRIEGEKSRRNRKKKRGKAEGENDEARIRCSSLNELFRKLKGLKRYLRQKKGADAHLVKNNSKWKWYAQGLSLWPRERLSCVNPYVSLTETRGIAVKHSRADTDSDTRRSSERNSHIDTSTKETTKL
ncbi:hypothetical protein PIB30_018264 [Stylosanthes scabra]|uniref:Uncharacterized protein n=1 Tax=Stylosanthes scabra TaxID=79078 RepID=A0ABU6W7F1_9FABA|nr:hypothetical protein [Stylosanthes scabra]